MEAGNGRGLDQSLRAGQDAVIRAPIAKGSPDGVAGGLAGVCERKQRSQG